MKIATDEAGRSVTAGASGTANRNASSSAQPMIDE